ncbi:glutaredoxin family protein [Massilia sp. PAMC28688]|uniref:glutaredoxin family protein n=1 Tax=Massilia sp. PAMC28688 TaxID=2861283 RepID=UPI001C636DF2|nr:glutaredoxin family protein [Massilia sp. PAMC28688]QYF91882.1 glutaredoxin family protein [Massilia sp. PAMC28688]
MKAATPRRGALFNLAMGLALLAAAGGASAQMYKWVDANGKTHFTDQPPPANAKPAQIKSMSGGRVEVELPYVLATAVRNHPVVLYTTSPCAGCDMGRTYLKNRGIPFSEKTVNNGSDEEKLKEVGGDGSLPLLLVGRTKIAGYQVGSWDSALTHAQYPAKKALPSNYQYPAPQPAAPAQPKAAPATAPKPVPNDEIEDTDKTPRVPPPRNAPPGFKF